MGQRIKQPPVENLRTGDASTGDASQAWLSTLIDTMETVSHRDVQASACDPRLVSAVKRQLSRPTVTPRSLRPVHRGSIHNSAYGPKPFMI